MSQNLQNFQNHCLAWAATQLRSRRKAAGWQAFHDQEKEFCRVLIVL